MRQKLDYITLPQLIASVKQDLPSLESYIDEGKVIKTILWCNDKLGMPIRKLSEEIIYVRDYKGELPRNFQKVIYVAALSHTSFGVAQYTDPFRNGIDFTDENNFETVSFKEGCDSKTERSIVRKKGSLSQTIYNWTELALSPSSHIYSTSNCINRTLKGQYTINIEDGFIETPFREGELYLMYWANLEDEHGNIQVPFHPLITPWYEWAIKEKILMDMVMNSDADVANKLKLAQKEVMKSWLDAFNFTMEPGYQQLQQLKKKNEVDMYNKYFKWYK